MLKELQQGPKFVEHLYDQYSEKNNQVKVHNTTLSVSLSIKILYINIPEGINIVNPNVELITTLIRIAKYYTLNCKKHIFHFSALLLAKDCCLTALQKSFCWEDESKTSNV